MQILNNSDIYTLNRSTYVNLRWIAFIGQILAIFFVQFILNFDFNYLPCLSIIGLGVIVLLTAFKGVTEEHDLGPAFNEALPFTALLVVFFCIVGVIHDQNLFDPIIVYVLAQSTDIQAPLFFVANGVLSMISDNVFVATVYINEIKAALDSGMITRDQFDKLAVAVNTGTNIPSIATPNGQAAFLFLLG